jgi:thioredoxin-like negative regulator of GroEL
MASAPQREQASVAARGSGWSKTAPRARTRAPGAPAATGGPSLVFFYSETSGASRRADGFLAQVLQRRSNHSTFRLVRVDAEQRPDLVQRLQVNELPTLLVIADGRVRGRLAKPRGCKQISQLLAPWLR